MTFLLPLIVINDIFKEIIKVSHVNGIKFHAFKRIRGFRASKHMP